MGAADVLQRLKTIGATVRPLPGGQVEVLAPGGLSEADRQMIRDNKPDLIAYLAARPAPSIRADVLALVGLTGAEIEAMSARIAGLRRAGYGMDDAEQIADRLLMRDRTGLDMAACVECRRFTGRRCVAQQPVGAPHELRRCPAFSKLTKD
ncbi:MAG: hypothetical protein L6Q74_09030 [Sphaerotilus natans subsp. sulfidivorans]|uniref:hypothetical protein n=1 Tax=Sphaerotilus sulfidivorans TaxID=639200 RepID=UPI002354E19D|nr:hypothetical protein [Sphaerotilus sulfidivorans]MCK6402030.1 hypothetical protein [Sphaerotilus sulfidivorans]